MVMRPDGTNIKQIGSGQGPAYSAAGDRIAWSCTNEKAQGMIIVARPDGSDQQGVYATPPVDYPHSKGLSGDYLLTWSLDGTTLGFTQGSELYTVPVSGGEPRRVTANAALDTDPDWQPTVPSSGLALARIAFPQPACETKKSIATP
jgi:hypothetical protein